MTRPPAPWSSSAALLTAGDTWTWNGTTWTQLHLRASPPAGSGQVMAYDPATGNVVLFGGLYHGKLPGLQ